jgi:hypothetical protein
VGALLATVGGAVACASTGDARVAFFETLRGACGARYEGAKQFPDDTTDAFHGKLLVATVAECNDSQVRVPFVVGADSSRTWVFTTRDSTLELKHDHRHADGTPDSVTMYGGMANLDGAPMSQHFEADAYTARLIPAARTNVWTVTFSADAKELTYHLDRDAKPRFTAVLKRVN